MHGWQTTSAAVLQCVKQPLYYLLQDSDLFLLASLKAPHRTQAQYEDYRR
jgi:hypothetical protein